MAQQALELGYGVLRGNKPATSTVLLDPALITAENVGEYKGWTAVR
jgi:ribose transport system substrate-binding protein